MRWYVTWLLGLSSLAAACLVCCKSPIQQPKFAVEENEGAENDDPFAAAMYEFNMMKDPATGTIPAGFREQELKQVREIYARQLREGRMASNAYTQAGPNNVGGRTRSVVYDVRFNGTTNRCLLAGSVSGWIFKSTDDGNSWVRKTSSGFNISTIVQDPRSGHQDTWYYGTGESFGMPEQATPRPSGSGVFKSADNGESWTRLPTSNTGVFEYYDRREDVVWRLAVHPLTGDVYMAACGSIIRSQDGGATWNPVLAGLTDGAWHSTDIVITSTGRLYAAFGGYNGGDIDGIWTSVSGDPGSWTRIAGAGAGDSPAGWEVEGYYGRIVLAIAPSNENVMYAYTQALQNLCNNQNSVRLHKWDLSTGTWTNLSNNLPGCGSALPVIRTYAGYAMAIAVKPDNPDVVFIGGVDLYRSTDGFSSGNIDYISGSVTPGYGNHVDIHALVFKPGQPNVLTCANDGGMQQSPDAMAPYVNWVQMNNNYTTYQFYYVALDPRPGSEKVMGGAQDNGTVRNIGGEGSQFEGLVSGDGVCVGLSKETNGQYYEYGGYQYGNIFRRNADWSPFSYQDIWPTTAEKGGFFVTIFHLDPDNTEYLYLNAMGHLYRNTAASVATPYNWVEMTGYQNSYTDWWSDVQSLCTTRGPYKNSQSSLFIGAWGKIFRLDDPANAPPATIPVNISGPEVNIPSSPTEWTGWISSISVNPRNDDTVLVTFSTVNSVGIFWTGNAKSDHPTWVNVERNLTLPSVRSSAIAVTAEGVEYFVGTTAGLFHSTNPLTTSWTQEAAQEIGNVTVSDLALRPSDNRLLVGTHGNGMWTTSLSSPALPVTLVKFNGQLQNEHVQLQWITASEVNVSGFEIQRSYDGVNFSKIDFVKAIGNSSTDQHYHYSDPETAVEKNYYRLNMIDLDGKTKLSPVVQVRREGVIQWVTVTNPFTHQLDIRFARLPRGTVKLALYDMMGRMVMSSQIAAVTYPVLPLHDVERLGKGSYVLWVETEGKLFRMKVIRE